ncbi:hypothetical protein HY772_00045 [Candidatus Woesearchaeota archaeon]|nr:hypothetical protein [Candidatus Woesearchaeota archaeon]
MVTGVKGIPHYIQLGGADGKSCIGGFFAQPTGYGSYLEAINDAISKRGGDVLANPIIEQSATNFLGIIKTNCVRVSGIVLKIEVQMEEKKAQKIADEPDENQTDKKIWKINAPEKINKKIDVSMLKIRLLMGA